MNRQETAIGNGSRWLDGLGGPGRAVPRIIARRNGNFPLPNVRIGSLTDIRERIRDVRFIPKSRHGHRRHQCLLVPEADIAKRTCAVDRAA
jgi:hypothetical protein